MMKNTNFSWVGSVTDNESPLFFILGPCVIENEEHALKTAEFLIGLSEKLGFRFIYKSSFDKANRSSDKSYRGPGIEEGLQILDNIRSTYGIPVITDVHEVWQVGEVASVVDVIQIPAFLSRQTDLLCAAGFTGKPVFVKKAQFLAPEGMEHVIEKIEHGGNSKIWLGERGYTFGYHNLVVDFRNFSILKKFRKPVIFDATHAVQRPGQLGISTGGDRAFVPHLAAASVVQGIAGIFMEIHEDPDRALCDGPNSVRLSDLEKLLQYLIDLDRWHKTHAPSFFSELF